MIKSKVGIPTREAASEKKTASRIAWEAVISIGSTDRKLRGCLLDLLVSFEHALGDLDRCQLGSLGNDLLEPIDPSGFAVGLPLASPNHDRSEDFSRFKHGRFDARGTLVAPVE